MELLLEEITGKIIACGIEVHRTLGPGLLEYVYKKCLEYELKASGLNVVAELPVPLKYKSISFDYSYRLDLLVEDLIVVELKAINEVSSLHKAQLLTYLKLTNTKVGLLLNFNACSLRDGITRVVNTFNF